MTNRIVFCRFVVRFKKSWIVGTDGPWYRTVFSSLGKETIAIKREKSKDVAETANHVL